jgi:hypothetical protein
MMFGANKKGALRIVPCSVCGRLLHDEEDELPDKGTDGKFYWCSTEHTAEFMAGVEAWNEFEVENAKQVHEESLRRFAQIVREAVREELDRRGIR